MSDKRRVLVHDRMQKGYVYYLTEPEGRNFEPGFMPQLTPKLPAAAAAGGAALGV